MCVAIFIMQKNVKEFVPDYVDTDEQFLNDQV